MPRHFITTLAQAKAFVADHPHYGFNRKVEEVHAGNSVMCPDTLIGYELIWDIPRPGTVGEADRPLAAKWWEGAPELIPSTHFGYLAPPDPKFGRNGIYGDSGETVADDILSSVGI